MEEPVHIAQDSLFSTSSGWTNYSGFFNHAFLLLVISNGRVALENLIKYGILISPLEWLNILDSSSPGSWPNLTIVLCSNVSILTAFFIEKLLARGLLDNASGAVVYVFLIGAHLAIPPAAVLKIKHGNPLYSFWALIIIVIEALKLVSYGQVNYWQRLIRKDKKRSLNGTENDVQHAKGLKREETKKPVKDVNSTIAQLQYPNNLTLSNLYYYMMAPTLCYELNFPRTPAIRKTFIIKRITELICFSFVGVALCQQWVIPLVKNSLAPFSQLDLKRCIERVLKLAIPNHLIWLMFFYLYFHSFLNLIAEIMRFGDRQFYLDFWNSESVSVFWKTWNIPVHRWALRHVYRPCVRNGLSRNISALVVFIISAFFHEYLISIPLKMFRLWACAAMLLQLPLGIVTDRYVRGGRAGNIIVWLSLILGQPMAILMYVHDWYLYNHPEATTRT
uniref:O-acyltransferase n=1 Tax=Meloidogyne incognita TaxID=6306 RepID=A0A914KPZ1_MELIC